MTIAVTTSTPRGRSGRIRWIEVSEEPPFRFDPIAANRTIGNAERLGGFFFGHPAEETAFDDLSQALVEGRESFERTVERDECFRSILDGDVDLIEIEAMPLSAALVGADFSRVLDENAPHRLRRDGEKMRSARESRARLVGELHVRFVHERCRAQRMAGMLEPQLSVRDPPQLVVQ